MSIPVSGPGIHVGLDGSISTSFPAGIRVAGRVNAAHELPTMGRLNEMWYVGTGCYMWAGQGWVEVNGDWLNIPATTIDSILTWKGITVTISVPEDLTALFPCPHDLTPEDMGFFESVHPDHFKTFRGLWKAAWIDQRASEDFDTWRNHYAEDRQRDNEGGLW